MSNPTNATEFIKQAVETAVRDLKSTGIEHDFGETALQALEDYIELERQHFSEQAHQYQLATCGAYLGESICRSYNGYWVESSMGGQVVQLEGYTAEIDVFGKVSKWLASGSTGDSFVVFYRSIPMLMQYFKKEDTDNPDE